MPRSSIWSNVEDDIANAVARSSQTAQAERADEERRRARGYDPEFDEPSADIQVMEAADRLQSKFTRRVPCTRPFACFGCYAEIDASGDAPATAVAIVENWTGWADPFGPPDKWRTVRIFCGRCEPEETEHRKRKAGLSAEAAAEYDAQEDERRMCLDPWGRGDSGEDYFQSAEYKARKKAEARATKETQAKRLKTVEAGGGADFGAALKKLKVPVLKKLCGANGLAVGGTKPQLLERIHGAKLHGTLRTCPKCKKGPMELVYANGAADPTAIKCKKSFSAASKCGYERAFTPATKADVLTDALADTPERDLAGAGFEV
mmetsp:Transcript_4167/g.12276  ORF Transcript_4167/g.12276 Transcript_4167/m.12276 type:complete len:319 (+) Transcript_4167:833-1789(+)